MKKCPKCNANCLEDQKACDSCGFNFAEENLEPEVVNESPISFQEETKEEGPQVANDQVYEVTEDTVSEDANFSSSTEPVSNNKGKKGSKFVVGLVVVGIVALLAVASVLIFGKAFKGGEPEDILVEAFNQYQNSSAQDVTMDISITKFKMPDEGDPTVMALVSKMIKDFSLTIGAKSDIASKKFEGSYAVNMKGSELVKATIFYDTENIGLRIPMIYDKGFYVTKEDIKENMPSDMNINFMTAYSELLDLNTYESLKDISDDIAKKPVKEFLKKNLKTVSKEAVKIGDKSVKCTKYPLSFTGTEAFNLFEEILVNFFKDEKARGAVVEVIEKFATMVDENDLYMEMDITKEELADVMIQVREGINKISKEGKTIDEIFGESNSMEYAQFKLGMEMILTRLTLDMDIYLDKNNKLRKLDMVNGFDLKEFDLEAEVKLSIVINSFDKKIEFLSVDKANDINPLELSEDEQLELQMKIMENVEKNFSDNLYLQEILGGLQ